MGKIGFVLFPFIKQGKFYFSFSEVIQFCGISPFAMVKQLVYGGKTDDIVLPHGI